LTEKQINNETNISAIQQEKKEQTWFQGKNVYHQWPESGKSTACQRPEKADRIGRTTA